jgi:hypothetical protein
MAAVAELSLLCQIAKMAWERGGGRFCIFSNFLKNQISSILHEATCPCPKFPIFMKMLKKHFNNFLIFLEFCASQSLTLTLTLTLLQLIQSKNVDRRDGVGIGRKSRRRKGLDEEIRNMSSPT